MKAVSLFSGIGGLDYGFALAGIETVLQVEKDAWCRVVLEHHWPEVPRIDDVCKVDATTLERGSRDVIRRGEAGRGLFGGIDLVHGGFPCQDVSVAGKRAGLSGERSGLWHEFRRIVSELRPRWMVIENVPGLLSSGVEPGADFGVVLRGLVDLGYGVAWRVLDARWFGVPQRRRRVFIVGCLGDQARAAQVLAVCQSCGGHPQTRPEAWQDAPAETDGRVETTRHRVISQNGSDIQTSTEVGALKSSEGKSWSQLLAELPMTAATLSSGSHPESNLPGRHHEDDENLIVAEARALTARASGYRMDFETENFLVADTLRVEYGEQSFRGDGADNLVADDNLAVTDEVYAVADPTSAREGKTYTHEGKNNFRTHNVVEAWDDRNQAALDDTHHTLRGAGLQRSDVVSGGMGVRRLTPLECCRLQGFPDDWMDVLVDGKPIADSHKYRMLGNAVATVCAQWIGHRLAWVDAHA